VDVQIERAKGSWTLEKSISLRESAFAAQGAAHDLHRTLIYDLLDLRLPASPAMIPMVPLPEFARQVPLSWSVRGRVDESGSLPVVVIERHSAYLPPWGLPSGEGKHLATLTHSDDLRLLQSAAVLMSQKVTASPREELERIMSSYPSCTVVGISIGTSLWFLGTRDGVRRVARIRSERTEVDETTIGSAFYLLGLYRERRLADIESFRVVGAGCGPVLTVELYEP
jgi:hypothetical protein